MASNSFGNLFRITTWGESHGPAIGGVIDGCPAGLEISREEIQQELAFRMPLGNPYVTPRKEPDEVEILSGVFEGKTTGMPISLLIRNQTAESRPYQAIEHLLRPGHANYTYLQKYGRYDPRGGGRASGRETAVRVAAGAVAKKLLALEGIQTAAYLEALGPVALPSLEVGDLSLFRKQVYQSPVYCPDPDVSTAMMQVVEEAKKGGDSWGGIVHFIVQGLPAGLGDPVYDRLDARLAYAMLSLPASKGFEMGSGFAASKMQGSEHNDPFISTEEGIKTASNHAGGLLGGITTGMPLWGRVPFKPPSSIKIPQRSVDREGREAAFQIPPEGRHDPCVAIRAVPVVEAMVALVVADALLMQRCANLNSISHCC